MMTRIAVRRLFISALLPLCLLSGVKSFQPAVTAPQASSTHGQPTRLNSLAPAPFQTVPPIVDGWAFTETFDGDPSAPSQALLPQTFDYVVTHRTHPAAHFDPFVSFLADHGEDCSGPDPAVSPLPQHAVQTSHTSRGEQPDATFFVCKNHMMSSMGDVEGYSVTAFWPKQEFNFSGGGVLEFDVNINGDHSRSWWEVLIAPRSELKVGAARDWLPIDETYPKDRIIFDFDNSRRQIEIGTGALAPEGILLSEGDSQVWAERHPSDPANSDRRIRRTMRIVFDDNQITWSIETEDGSFDDFSVLVPSGLPFNQGLVLFKTHAYTPTKDGNQNNYTFHWDNVRFSGPLVGLYESYEAEEVVYLQANGDRAVGSSETVVIRLPELESSVRLFGQVHGPMQGQVLLRINDGDEFVVNPYDYNVNDCYSNGWKSFQLQLDPEWLQEGENEFTWTVGPRPDCVDDWVWNGFSIKSLEVQADLIPAMPYQGHISLLPLVRR